MFRAIDEDGYLDRQEEEAAERRRGGRLVRSQLVIESVTSPLEKNGRMQKDRQ